MHSVAWVGGKSWLWIVVVSASLFEMIEPLMVVVEWGWERVMGAVEVGMVEGGPAVGLVGIAQVGCHD